MEKSDRWTAEDVMGVALLAGVVVFILFVLGAVIVGAMKGGSSDSSPSKATGPRDRSLAAFSMCKEFVRDGLPSPSSATFRNPNEDDGEVLIEGSGDGPYTIESSVDSDTPFGANDRQSFTCTVSRLPNDEWQLIDIDFR